MNTEPTKQSLLDALNINELELAEQEELLLELNDLVVNGSMLRLMEQMDEEIKVDFEKLLDSDASDEQIEDFLSERVPQAGQAVSDTIQELRDDILAATGASQD